MKILVTGGNGFIGNNLIPNLQNKHQVLSPSHIELDITNYHYLESYFQNHKIDCVIHSAVNGNTRIPESNHLNFYQNLQMFFNLVNCQKYFSRLIYFGSGAEYDKSIPLTKVDELNFGKNVPANDYGYFKYLCQFYTLNNKLKNIYNLRLFGIYGPHENYLIKFISNSIVKNILHLPIIINQNVIFDYLYIDDLFPIVDYFISNHPKFPDYNICTGKTVDLLTIAKKIIDISDFQSDIVIKKSGLNHEYSGSNQRLLNEIPKTSFTSINDGITRLFKYYQTNIHLLDIQKIKDDSYLSFCKTAN